LPDAYGLKLRSLRKAKITRGLKTHVYTRLGLRKPQKPWVKRFKKCRILGSVSRGNFEKRLENSGHQARFVNIV